MSRKPKEISLAPPTAAPTGPRTIRLSTTERAELAAIVATERALAAEVELVKLQRAQWEASIARRYQIGRDERVIIDSSGAGAAAATEKAAG